MLKLERATIDLPLRPELTSIFANFYGPPHILDPLSMSFASFSGGIQLWGSTGSVVNIHGQANAPWDLKDIKRQRQLQLMLDFMFGVS